MEASGESRHQLDDKGRLNIPKRFLSLFEHGGFLTRAYNGLSLVYYPQVSWQTEQRKIDAIKAKLSEQDPAQYLKAELATEKIRRFLNCGQMVALDTQGRLTIPQNLRDRARLNREVTVIGMGDTIEIWDTKTWEEYDQQLQPLEMGEELSRLSQRPLAATLSQY